MPGPGVLAVVVIAVFVGAALNALAGFGFALVTVPVMALVVGPKDAVVLSAIVGLVSNWGVLVRNRSDVDRPVAARVLLGSMVGMPLGVLVLTRIAEDPLKILIAVAVLASAAVLATGRTLADPRPRTDVVAGFASGLFNTSIGISGPPVVMLLAGRGMAKAPFRATSVTVFGIAGVVALVLFGISGRYDQTVLVAAAVALPAMPLGWLTGDRLHRRFDEEPFRRLVLVLMVVTASVVIAGVIGG